MTQQDLLGRITATPEIFGGKPIVRGMRISVELILSLLAQGENGGDSQPTIRTSSLRISAPASRTLTL